MASWSDIEPEEVPAIASRETEREQKRPAFSLELSSREDDFRLIHLKRCFNRCDTDKDGCIDSRELRKLCVLLDMPQFASGESAAALFKALDVNSRGKIAFKDFLRYKNIYLKSALSVVSTPDKTGSLSPASSVTNSSYQEAVMSLDSEVETGQTAFESPLKEAFLHRTDPRRLQEASDSSGSPDKFGTGQKGEKRHTRPSSAGLASAASSRKANRPSSAEHRFSDFDNSNPSLSLRASSVTLLSAYSGKDEPTRARLSSSHGYIHQLLSQQAANDALAGEDTETGQDEVTSSTPVTAQQTKLKKRISVLDSPIFTPPIPTGSLPMEALPSAPVCVLQSMVPDGSDYISMSEVLELLQALGFDRNDVSEDLDKVLLEVPRDGEGGLSVIGVALAMERILVGEEDVPEGSLLRQLSLKLYQQEIVLWRRTHQFSMAEKSQLLENLDYHRGEQRRLLNWGDEQAEIEALHWDRKLRELEQKCKLKMKALEDSKRAEMENLMERTTKEIEDREKANEKLQNESDQLRELMKDLKTDKKYMSRQLDDYRIKSSHSERIIEALQLQLQDSLGGSGLSDMSLETEIGRSELDRVIDEKNQILDSHKYLQDNYDELQAENQKIQQQLRSLQIRYKHSVKAMAARPVNVPKVIPPIPRNRHSKSLSEPPDVDPAPSPEPVRKNDSLMVEMIDHDFQAREKQRMTQLEELCTDLELRLDQMELEKKTAEAKLLETEQGRERERQKKKKDDKITNSKISDLESDNLQLSALRSDAEDRLNTTQCNLSRVTAELNEVQKEFATLTRKIQDLELERNSLSSQNTDLQLAGRDNELRETELLNERSQLKKQVQSLQTDLSTCKSKYDTHTFELERLLAETEQQIAGIKLENEHTVKRMQQDIATSNELISEMKKEHTHVVNSLKERLTELDNSLTEATHKHRQEVESMSDEIRKAGEREKASREAKHSIERELAETKSHLVEATNNRDAVERARASLSESLERSRAEREQLEKQLKSEISTLNERLHATYGDIAVKLEQADASQKQLLSEVRGEYETQISRLHQEMREYTQSAVSAENKSRIEITTLTAQIESYKNELSKLEDLLAQSRLESAASEDDKRVTVQEVLLELEKCRAEMDLSSESHFETVNQLKEKLSSVEEKLNEVRLQADLDKSELEENIQNYEEREQMLIEEYEMRLIELQKKFDNEITARSLDEEKIAEEMEQLTLELEESRGEIKRLRNSHLEEMQKLKRDEQDAVRSLNDLKKSKEIEITKLRNSVLECESKIRALEQTETATASTLLKKSLAIDSISSELEFSKNARKHLEKQLGLLKGEFDAVRQEEDLLNRKVNDSMREFEEDRRQSELDKLRYISGLESKHSMQITQLKSEIESKLTEINILKMRLIEADAIKSGEDLNSQWKSHIQELTSQIRELERQIKSKDSIIEQIRKDTKEFNEFKGRLDHFRQEKEALLSIIENIALIEYRLDTDESP